MKIRNTRPPTVKKRLKAFENRLNFQSYSRHKDEYFKRDETILVKRHPALLNKNRNNLKILFNPPPSKKRPQIIYKNYSSTNLPLSQQVKTNQVNKNDRRLSPLSSPNFTGIYLTRIPPPPIQPLFKGISPRVFWGEGRIAGWNFGTKVEKKKKRNVVAKLRKREDRESRSALRICNRKRGGVREGGGVFSLADIRILESDTDMQCTGRTCRDGNSFTRAANFSTFRVERRKVPSSFSSIGNTWKHVAHHRES